MTDPIQEALAKARTKLTELVSERTRIDKEIVDWKRVADSLTVVAEERSGELPTDLDLRVSPQIATAMKLSFTDAIRNVLQIFNCPLAAPTIRDRLLEMGFDLSKYKQELVPIHNTLRRLEEQGEVRTVKNEQGQTVGYQWMSPLQRALAEKPFDPAKTAAVMYRDTETASADNQPFSTKLGRHKLPGQIRHGKR